MADLIDRDAIIKQIAETQDKVSSGIEDVTFYRAIKIIRNAPAVNRWIPCSERLPEQGERVIVAIFGSDMIMPNEGETLQDAIERSRKEGYITVGFIGSDGWYGADWFPLMVHPSYWMPKPDLPEPPESEVQKDAETD